MLICVMSAAAFAANASAQPNHSTSQLPNAASASQKPSARGGPASNGTVRLLAGRSRIFPDLAVDTKPLTPKEKLGLAARDSVSGLTIIGSAMGAGISQARDTYSGYGQGAEGYFQRFGASMGFAATSNVLGTFALASLLHEDPRYFVLNSPSVRNSVRYAVTRVFVTRMDDGTHGANWAGMLGPLGAAAVANTYLPAGSQGVGHTFEHWGVALAISAGSNVLREYWPRINKKLRLPDIGITSPSTVGRPPPAQPPQP